MPKELDIVSDLETLFIKEVCPPQISEYGGNERGRGCSHDTCGGVQPQQLVDAD
jgi:hypothetical protein